MLIRSTFILLSICTFTCFNTHLFAEIPAESLMVMPPLNQIYHPVSTTNPEAQKSFDKGLTYIFAFNHDIAFAAFQNAAKIDPNLAMAYWGMALALGQNINTDVTPENEIKCYEFVHKALQLAPNASKSEQDYISALVVRYTNDPSADLIPLRFTYRDAMKKLMTAYPEDLDAVTLYTESILDLSPWKYWSLKGEPLEGTLEAISILESVLKRNPYHIGANHYYIHALEASPSPERALMSANRLTHLLPASGHLLHMPCHIFVLVGNYNKALLTSKKAIAADKEYIKVNGMGGNYPLHYLSHNLTVLVRIYRLMEDYENAIKTALELNQFVAPHYESMPNMAHYAYTPLEVYLYFNKWKEILEFKPSTNAPIVQSYWHYSRATAFASLGDFASAQNEKKLMLESKKQISKKEEVSNNPSVRIIDLAEIMLDATFALAQNKYSDYVNHLEKAVAAEDVLNYDEPSAWYIPLRQTLGAALLHQKRYVEAEAAFNKTLENLQRNGRSLFGLSLSLKGQNRTIDAYWVEREMKAALKYATKTLELDDLSR